MNIKHKVQNELVSGCIDLLKKSGSIADPIPSTRDLVFLAAMFRQGVLVSKSFLALVARERNSFMFHNVHIIVTFLCESPATDITPETERARMTLVRKTKIFLATKRVVTFGHWYRRVN